MASIGQLAAGIAHEINTPTQYVSDNTRFLRDAFGDLAGLLTEFSGLLEAARAETPVRDMISAIDDSLEKADLGYLMEEIPKAIDQSLDGVERISKIVLAMKEFSHPGVNGKTGVDINKAIASTITVASNEWKYVTELQTEFDPSLPLVPCLAAELNQVILNLIINAAHAIAELTRDGRKGTITVRTRRVGSMAEISISDTGCGIPEEIRSRVFDPFFTTKEVGKGTGQGLAISRSVIVDKHDGTISFETEDGKGTTFFIRLPLADPAEA